MRRPRRLVWAVALWCVVEGGARAACPQPDPALESGGDADTLVVLMHAYNGNAAALASVREAIGEAQGFGATDFLVPDLPFGLLSMARAEDVLADLLFRIDCLWETRLSGGRPYGRVVLVGHSMGALYARKLYVLAAGENADAPFEEELERAVVARGAQPLTGQRPWATAVERIVLLAGMNRGWSISHHMSLTRAVSMTLGVGAGRVLSLLHGHDPIIFGIRRGAPFITQLRLQWLSMRERAAEKGVGAALTVQLLGTTDDLVSPEDNIDLVTGHDFIYLEVPFSGHADVIRMGDGAPHGAARRGVLQQAVTRTADALQELGTTTMLALSPDGLLVQPRPDVRDVVFVIHGIRDEGFWTRRIAGRVIAEGMRRCAAGGEGDGAALADCPPVATVTSGYGYFPMLSFLWPRAREEKVEWLMDQYTQARATYPNARFSYVGHSHGTYLLARALREYPAARFHNVVFAGSVVQRDYDWAELLRGGRVERVANFRATADWVVAFFPKTLEMLGLQDLGAAGHDGFIVEQPLDGLVQPPVRIVGGHGAALQEPMWDAIAGFLLGGELALPGAVETHRSATWWVKFPAYAAPLVWLLIAGLLLLVLRWLLRLDLAQWQRTLALVGYAWVVWTVLTEV